MKNIVFVTILFLVLGTVVFLNYLNNSKKDFSITSPLPDLLTKTFPSVLGTTDLWKPNIFEVTNPKIQKPQVTAAVALSYDLTENKLLYGKNIKSRAPLASLTKIATAIVALENMDIDKKITVGQMAAQVGEDSMGLTNGEQLTLEELLYGMILHSGNDAAEAIAAGSNFGRANFVYLMNKKVEDLGLSDTHFTNPTGLEGDGKQYSTAYDLVAITRNALENPEFAKVVSTVEYEMPATDFHKYFYMFNGTNLLTSYPGVKGVKTGYTDEAGLCLVTYLEYEEHRIIAVLLNAENRRQEMKDLLDYSLKTLGVKPPPHG